MASLLDLRQLRRISVEERFTMIKQIWETILDEEDTFELTPELEAELKRRLADLEANPDAGSPWEEVEARLRRRLKTMRSSSRPRRKGTSKKQVNGTKNGRKR